MIILHMFLLFFSVKKVVDFLYHRPEMHRNITCGKIFNCLFLLHSNTSRFVLRIKKSVRFQLPYRLVLRTDFNPDYLIFNRFYLKNRITIKPTLKPLIFSVSTPVAVVAIFLATLWQTTVILLSDKREQKRLSAFVPRYRKRIFGQIFHARQRLSSRRMA